MLRSVSIFSLLVAPAVVSAETDPALLRFIAPNSKAVISVDWKTLKASHIGALLREKFVDSNPGSAMPGTEFLDDVDRCIISSPGRTSAIETTDAPMLIVVHGHFDLGKVRKLLAQHGAKPQMFNSIQVYRPQGKSSHDMAFVLVDAQTILIGDAPSVFAGVERSANPATPESTSLLARVTEMDSRYDVWALMTGFTSMASDRLMGLLAGGGPSGSEARSFEAGVSLRNGLVADISLFFPSEPEARSVASEFSKLIKAAVKDKIGGPAMIDLEKKLKIAADGAVAKISLRLTPQELEKNARIFAAARPQPVVAQADIQPVTRGLPPVAKAEPKVIRIEGLDEGTREIKMKQDQP